MLATQKCEFEREFLHHLPSVATTPALDVMIVRIVRLCLLSPITRAVAAFHISFVLHVTLTLLAYINGHAVLRQFFFSRCFSFKHGSSVLVAPDL